MSQVAGRIILDKGSSVRRHRLGMLGEGLAEEALLKNGFINVLNANKAIQPNFRFADILAEKDGMQYAISVKARNKYQFRLNPNGTKRLNDRYKLGAKCHGLASEVCTQFGTVAAWVVVSVDADEGVYDAYFGLLSELNGNLGVPMSKSARKSHKCLAEHEPYDCEDEIKNEYRTQS